MIRMERRSIVIHLKTDVKNSSKNIEMNALSLFYHIIISQWFFDGNKRTAFVIANKILLKNGIGLLIVEDKNNEKFNQLLYDCYKQENRLNKES